MIKRIVGNILVFLCAIFAIQIPAFIDAYSQRLGGHIAELQWQIQQLELLSMQSGKNLDSYIQKFLAQDDADFYSQGIYIQNLTLRKNQLQSHLEKIENAPAGFKFFIFLKNLDIHIARESILHFKPSLPLTMSAALYGLIGLLIGSLLAEVVFHIPKYLSRRYVNNKNSI